MRRISPRQHRGKLRGEQLPGPSATMDYDQIRHRLNAMTWAIGAIAAFAIATLILVIMLSYRLTEELSDTIAAEANESPP